MVPEKKKKKKKGGFDLRIMQRVTKLMDDHGMIFEVA